MKIPEKLKMLEKMLVAKPTPITGLETIQLILLRETLDYIVLRTEEDRELNVVSTVKMLGNTEEIMRVAFLGGKQKAVESRQMERMLRTAATETKKEIEECYLKDHLCLACPRCVLFGGTNASSVKKSKSNIKHRIAYATAYSLNSIEEVRETITFNAISDGSQTTGQALGERVAVKPGTVFPAIVTFSAVTWIEFVLAVKAILSAHKYGAESRIGGDIRNHLVGIAAGWEEILTPLELTLELAGEDSINETSVEKILTNYKKVAANPDKVIIIPAGKVTEIAAEISGITLERALLDEAYDQAKEFRTMQGG